LAIRSVSLVGDCVWRRSSSRSSLNRMLPTSGGAEGRNALPDSITNVRIAPSAG
jgi:hypothetical protein